MIAKTILKKNKVEELTDLASRLPVIMSVVLTLGQTDQWKRIKKTLISHTEKNECHHLCHTQEFWFEM